MEYNPLRTIAELTHPDEVPPKKRFGKFGVPKGFQMVDDVRDDESLSRVRYNGHDILVDTNNFEVYACGDRGSILHVGNFGSMENWYATQKCILEMDEATRDLGRSFGNLVEWFASKSDRLN